MDEAKLLLNAYYETLYDRLAAQKESMEARIEELLRQEVKRQRFKDFNEEKYAAYLDACLAFVDERLESYNPIGIQYTFERVRAQEAVELELQLNWYDSRVELRALMEAVMDKAQAGMTEKKMRQLAKELIKQLGAYPDKSIITDYEAGPDLGKLPDYVVARAIEEVIG